MTYHVFISHSSKDKALADAVCAALEANGVRCWIAPRDILPSESWAAAILRGISQSKMMVLIFSANANGSHHVHREVERAVAHTMPVLPVRVEDVLPAAELEYFLSSAHWLNALKPPFEQHLRDLSATVRAVLEAKGASPGPVPNLVADQKAPLVAPTLNVGNVTAVPKASPQLVAVPPRKSRGGLVAMVAGVVVLFLALAAGGSWLAIKFMKPAVQVAVAPANPLDPAGTGSQPPTAPEHAKPPTATYVVPSPEHPQPPQPPAYIPSPVTPAPATDDAAQRAAAQKAEADRLAAQKAEADRLAAQKAVAQRATQVAQLLETARSNDSPENGKNALLSLNDVLSLDPQNAEALRLKDKISAYYAPTLTNSLKMLMVRIEPGEFMMGTPATETGHAIDETQHRVKITKAYMLAANLVTQGQWSALMSENPSKFKGDNLPVESVTWDDAVQFCEKLSAKEQKHYHLPTEAQWEYACRAGTTTPFYFGQTISSELANYDAKTAYGNGVKGESRMKTTPVGIFKPNAWGLFDMCGNVNQWCSDWYSTYPAGEAVDPAGPATPPANASWRVLRGGSWGSAPALCRSGARYKSPPINRFDFYGFRVALDLQ
jgi:formylglycine-generating enzyme required for sulfatase activity